MEPKDSLLCSQECAIGPYPKPDKSSPACFLRLVLVSSSRICLGVPITFSF